MMTFVARSSAAMTSIRMRVEYPPRRQGMSIRTRVAGLAIVGLLCAPVASAQVPNAPSARLAKITTLKCTFSVMTMGNWKSGAAEASTKPAKLVVGFNAVDVQDGTAEAVGDSGKSHIT